jgi:protein NRD1
VNRTGEDELRAIFSAYGRVQTCIVNIDKRHAFVKMINRKEAVQAKEALEHYKSGDMQLRVSFPPLNLKPFLFILF